LTFFLSVFSIKFF